jgi:hypothetical protein
MKQIWSLMRDGALFKLDVTVGGRFDHDRLDDRTLLLSAVNGGLHGHVYDTKYRLSLDGPVTFDTYVHRGHFTFTTQYGPRRGWIGEEWTDQSLVEDALSALAVWQDRLKEVGALAGFDGNEWKTKAAAAAQEVYDSWQQDADGDDEVYGGGGICDDVAVAVAEVLIEQNVEAFTHHYEQDNHTVVIAKMNEQTVEVDIPMHLYERGSWYSYRKVPGVTFGPEHITVVPLGDEDVFDAMVNE